MDEIRTLTSSEYLSQTLVWNWAWGEAAWAKVTVFQPGLNKKLNILCYDPKQAQNDQEVRSLLLLLMLPLLLPVEEPHIGSTDWQGKSIAAGHQPEWARKGLAFPSNQMEKFWYITCRCIMPLGTLTNGRQVLTGSFRINSSPSLI